MLSSGFYNSKGGDRKYDAEQFGAMFNGLITDGVFAHYKDALKVTAGSGNRELVVKPGRAWFNGTWTEVDDNGHSVYLMGSAVETTYFVYLAVNKLDRKNTIAWYSNIANNDPEKGLYFYLMAQVTVPGGVTKISDSMITDTRGSDLCPYVTGIMETVSFEDLVKRVCGDNWQDWLGVYEAGITTGVQNAVATSERALDEVKSMKAYAVESEAVSYIWAKFEAVPTGGGGFEWATDAVHTELSDPPMPMCLFRDLSYVDLGSGFKPSVALNSPYISEGETTVKAIPAVTQSKVWKEYPYFWEGGAAYGTEVLRYDELQRVVVNVGGTASEKYRYRISRLMHIPVIYEPGAYIGTVSATNATAYPRDGYKDGYYYMRFASRAEDVSFYYPGLSAKNVRDAIIEVVHTGGNGSGTTMSVIEVEELPSTGVRGVFYIVKKAGDSDASEYLWLGRWEKIGGTGSDSGQNLALDTTLTKSGEAADAKAVGDALDELEEKIPTKPEDVGADPNGTAASAVSAHNTSTDAHHDLRLAVQQLQAAVNAFLDVDDTTRDELSEVLALIDANADVIESITTGKVSVADIVNNLTTNVANRPLSAAQGVALKTLVDNLSASLANYQPKGNYALASAVPTKVSQLANDKGYLTEHQDISGKADKFDPTVYGLPVLWLTGDTAPIAVSKDNKVTMNYVWGERSGTCTLKGQGATSYKTAQALVNAGKKGKFNYTIKFDAAFEAKGGWGEHEKYCLKANWIDPTHSRNIGSCKQWGMIVKSRSNVPAELANLPNGGAIDGFPVIIMLNGEFHGLYTWNIPKDGWMFGLVEDAAKTQAVVGANDHELATQFKGELAGDESDFELEFVSDKTNTAWVNESLNRLINAVHNSNGSDLDTVVARYIDWDSAIDYLIHCVVEKATDCVDKNFLLVTFDGVKWYFSNYDRDSIWLLNWDASGLSRPVSGVSFADCATTSRMWELIYRFKTDRLKERYWELRERILSESKIMQTFENFAWAIPSPVMLEDAKLYPTILGSSVNTIDQIGRAVRQRLEVTDEWVKNLPAQETPAEPEEPSEMINQVPISTDTDGSIYNGTGYKDDTRLSSSGGVSGTAQAGSVTTGFVPWTRDKAIYMKGAEWLHATANHTGHFYLNFYDASKTFVVDTGVSSNSYDAADSVFPANITITYDEATGVTKFELIPNEWLYDLLISAAYIRLNAYGKGADLIVTVNQEITE